MRRHLYKILNFYFKLQSASILQRTLIHGIHLLWKSNKAENFLNGFINILKPTKTSTDSSSWLQELITWDLKETKKMNPPTSAELTPPISNIISNTRQTIHPDKDKLFFQEINSKMLKFKDQLALADLVLIILFYNQIKIKLTNLIRFKRKYLDIV